MPAARLIVAALAAAALLPPAHAIIRRHDRDDARYLELARGLDAVVDVGGGAGTLVAPRWVLTAGHVAESVTPAARSVEIGGRWFVVDRIVYQPSWRGEASRESPDIALLRLAEAVTEVEPMPLYEWTDEAGKTVIFAGRGMFGTGESGPTGEDGRLRAATNTVAETVEGWMSFQFDAPPGATDLEGISGPGDSGGPALIERDGRRWIAGVSSSNDDHGLGHCRYGTTEYYARVASCLDWLRGTMSAGLDAPADDVPPLRRLVDHAWPDTPAGRVARAFFEHYEKTNGAAAGAMRAFEETWRAASALAERSVDQRVARWPELMQRFGPQTPVAFAAIGPREIEVLGRGPTDADWWSFTFECEAEEPHKLLGIRIARARPLRG